MEGHRRVLNERVRTKGATWYDAIVQLADCGLEGVLGNGKYTLQGKETKGDEGCPLALEGKVNTVYDSLSPFHPNVYNVDQALRSKVEQ